jgi:L-ascorbate metabolism protein UlaG (beta-lactamase superfamily)
LEGFVGSREVQDISIMGISTFHDVAGGNQRGKNSVYVVQFDGLAFCHLGDLGHKLTAGQAIEIGNVDVLFVPVGGGPTIGPEIASFTVEMLKPKIVVPMHYNLGLTGMAAFLNRLNRVEDFLKGKKNVKKIEGSSLIVTKDNLPKKQTIIVPYLKNDE